MKEVDLTDKISFIPIEDQIKFIDNPSLKDLEEAQEKGFIIICRMQGTVQEKLAQVKEIKERLGDSFISNRLVLEGYFKDELYFSKEDYQSLIRGYYARYPKRNT
jgi:hypothetical protein